jgi:hypothetical protein
MTVLALRSVCEPLPPATERAYASRNASRDNTGALKARRERGRD